MKNSLQPDSATVLGDCAAFVESYDADQFLQDLCIFLCNRLNIAFALIGYPDTVPNQITTAALAVNGALAANLTYSLKGTPCEGVVGKNSCFFPSGVQRLFPEDEELKTWGVESYFGTPLVCSSGNPLGLIAIMDTKKIVQGSLLDKALQILTPRTELELMKFLCKKKGS